MGEDEVPPVVDFGFEPDAWFDGVDARPPNAASLEAASLPKLDVIEEGSVLEASAPPALVRKVVKGCATVVFDYPYSYKRDGRKRFCVDRILAIGELGQLLLRAVVEQCVGKSPDGWKVHLTAINYVADELAIRGGMFADGMAIPADTLLAVERRLAEKRGNLSASASGYLRAAGRVVRRVPGTAGVSYATFDGAERDRDPTSEVEEDLNSPTDIEIEDLIRLVMRRVLRTMAVDAQVRTSFDKSGTDGPLDPDLARCAAFLRLHYPQRPPRAGDMRMSHPKVASEIDEFGWAEVRRAAYPTCDDLLPFLVLLAFYTRLNPSVLCGLLLHQIEKTTFMGQQIGVLTNAPSERVELAPFKPRQGRHQHVSFAITGEPDNPDVLIDFLIRWTAGIRLAARGSADRLFIFTHKGRHSAIGDFVFDKNTFAVGMKQLCKDARTRAITPKQLRPAAVDLIFQASGGDMALVRASGWWRSVSTPERVYLGPRTRRRGEEDLAFQQVLENRRRRFGIDVANRPDWMDRGAATPGWVCYDPFGGPLRTKRGELCAAIGLCPLCPNADLDTDVPEVFSWVVALGLALLGKRNDMLEEHWRAKWEPVLDGLVTDWLPLFSEKVVGRARRSPPVSMEIF